MTLRMYSDLASWWPLLSPPSHYVEEAADLLPVLIGATEAPPRTMLELGSGGGSLAFHFKDRLTLTLTDRSPDMLAVSRTVNPECEHIVGDMTSLDLGREFDRVFVHDAIMYAADRDALQATMRTAYRHCRHGGVAVFVPDHVRETLTPATESGGEDSPDGRGLRYLEWSWDPDSADDTYEVAYAFLLREADGRVQVEGEQHRHGCFARAAWLAWLRETGFDPRVRTDPWNRDVFIGRRPIERGKHEKVHGSLFDIRGNGLLSQQRDPAERRAGLSRLGSRSARRRSRIGGEPESDKTYE